MKRTLILGLLTAALIAQAAADCLGDINRDGMVNEDDLRFLYGHLMGNISIDEACADMNLDGRIDWDDYLCLDLLLSNEMGTYLSMSCSPPQNHTLGLSVSFMYSLWDWGEVFLYSSGEAEMIFDHGGARLYPMATDIDGDGVSELIMGTGYPGWLAVLAHDFFPYMIGRGDAWVDLRPFNPGPTFRIAPVRGYHKHLGGGYDPVQENLVIGYPKGSWIQILEYDSGSRAFMPEITPLSKNGWYRYSTNNYESYPGAGDIDGDGRDEIVIATNARSGWVFIYDDNRQPMATGSRWPGWLKTDPAPSRYITPRFADLNSDGRDNFILHDRRTLVGYGFDGSSFGKLFTYTLSREADGFDKTWAVSLGDATGDGENEILVGSSAESSLINVYSYDASSQSIRLISSVDTGEMAWAVPAVMGASGTHNQYPELALLEPSITYLPEEGVHYVEQNGVVFPICGELDLRWCGNENPNATGDGPFEFRWGDGSVSCSWFLGNHSYPKTGEYEIEVSAKNTCGFISSSTNEIIVGNQCGDGLCSVGENCSNCPQDCGLCDDETTGDFVLYNIQINILDKRGNPIDNVEIRLYNKDHLIYFPIKTAWDDSWGCNKAVNDPYYYATADSTGKVSIKAVPGNYLLFARKRGDPSRMLFLESEVDITGHSTITMGVEKEIRLEFLKPDSSVLESPEVWATNSDLRPGFPPFYYGNVDSGAILETNTNSRPMLLIVKQPSDNEAGYAYVKGLELYNQTNEIVIGGDSNLAELTFNSYGPNNTLEPIGRVQMEFKDFFLENFGISIHTTPSAKMYITPNQNIYLWFWVDASGQHFAFAKRGGNILPLSARQRETINFGGLFDLRLGTESYEPLIMPSTHFWFLVKDGFGNVMKHYVTKNPGPPQIRVECGDNIVIDRPLENYHPDVFTEMSYDVPFSELRNCLVTFNEDLHEFGSININRAPIESLLFEIVSFESENIEFKIPKELEFLKPDITENFQKFYDEMYKLMGVKTAEKVPFRTWVGGADIAWAPIDWPMVMYECDTRNYQCWFLIGHEIGHPYTINDPISCRSEIGCPFDEESKASYLGIRSMQAVNTNVGKFFKANYPIVFKYLEDPDICYDRVEIVQTLMLYMDAKHPRTNPSATLIRDWNMQYRRIYDRLGDLGYNHDEAYGALYSIVLEKNVGDVFETFGLAEKSRIGSALVELNYTF
jgi:hypothetical protein